MTDLVFAANVPQRVRHMVRAAMALIDANGEVVGGMKALQAAIGHGEASTTRATLRMAEAAGLMRRAGRTATGKPRRVFVVVRRLFGSSACLTPSCARAPWKDGRCVACWNVERADREWRHRAVELAVSGMTPPKIAAHLQQSLFPDVVGHLLAEGLLGEEWAKALREATGRKPDPTRAARVRAFRERRRAAAKVGE